VNVNLDALYAQSAFVLVHRSNLRATRVQSPLVFGLPSRSIILYVQTSFTSIYRSCCSHHSSFVVLLVRTLFLSKHTSCRNHRLRANLIAFNPNSWSVGVDHRKHRQKLDDFALCRHCRLDPSPAPHFYGSFIQWYGTAASNSMERGRPFWRRHA
jgi:hypothetical protein